MRLERVIEGLAGLTIQLRFRLQPIVHLVAWGEASRFGLGVGEARNVGAAATIGKASRRARGAAQFGMQTIFVAGCGLAHDLCLSGVIVVKVHLGAAGASG